MDPLSVFASAIAITQATESLMSLLLQWKSAPDEVTALFNELSDLKIALHNASVAAKANHHLMSKQVSEDMRGTLQRIENKVEELDAIVQSVIIRVPDNINWERTKIKRLKWMPMKSKVYGLTQELRQLKSTLLIQQTSVNS
jgi:hypothetical protein